MDATWNMAIVSVNIENICEFMFSHNFHLVFSLLSEKFKGLKIAGCILIVAFTNDWFGLQSKVVGCYPNYFLAPYCSKEYCIYPKRQCDQHRGI